MSLSRRTSWLGIWLAGAAVAGALRLGAVGAKGFADGTSSPETGKATAPAAAPSGAGSLTAGPTALADPPLATPQPSPTPAPVGGQGSGDGPSCAVWAGTWGNEAVVLALSAGALTEGTWLAEYGIPHTESRGRLAGVHLGSRWRFDELGPRPGTRAGGWFLEGDGARMEGTWRSSDARRTAPLALRCLVRMDGTAVDASAALLVGGGTPSQQFARLLRRGTSLETETASGTALFKNAVDVVRGRAYLQLTGLDEGRGHRPALLREINERIRQHVAKAVRDQAEGREQFGECDVETTVEVKFASSHYLTLATFDEWACGTPAPEQSLALETFDISGERAVEVVLPELYQINRDAKTKRAFWRLLTGNHEAQPHPCLERLPPTTHYELGLVRDGVLVHVDGGSYGSGLCEADVVVPSRALQRLTRRTGKGSFRTSGLVDRGATPARRRQRQGPASF